MDDRDESSSLLKKTNKVESSGLGSTRLSYGTAQVEMKPLGGSSLGDDDGALPQRMYNNLTSMIRSIHHTVKADKTEEIQILTEATREGQGQPERAGPRSPPHLKGYDRSHMVIEHGDHIGILVDGKMQCFERGDYELENLCFDCQGSIKDLRNCCVDAKPDGPCHIYANVVPCSQSTGSVALRRATTSCNIHSILPSPKEPKGGRHASTEADEHFDYVALNNEDKLEFHRMHLLADGLKRIDVRGAIDSVPDETCSLLGDVTTAARSTPWRFRIDMSSFFGASDASSIRVTRLRVASMCCDLEAKLIKKLIGGKPGLKSLSINVVGRLAIVKHVPEQLPLEVILDTLNDAQLGVSVQGTAGENEGDNEEDSPLAEYARTGGSVLFFLAALVTSLFEAKSQAPEGLFKYHIGTVAILCFVSVVVGFGPILVRAVSAARYGVVDVTSLMVVAVAGALLGGKWIEAAAVAAIFALAENLEDACMRHVRKALAEATALMPTTAVLAQTSRTGKEGETVPIASLTVGDVVGASPGDMIPVDGKVAKGGASVDESSLTGEAMGVPKEVGSVVHGGTIVVNGYIEVEATKAASESTLSQLETMIQDAQASESNMQRTVDYFAARYTPLVLLATLIIAVVVPAILGGGEEVWSQWLERGIVVLVMACPCALVMSAPVPVVCAIAACAKNQFLVKSAATMERLATLEHVALDKTGTLSEGRFRVIVTQPIGGHDERATMMLAAAVESKSKHPLANAIVNEAIGCATEMYEAGESPFETVKGFKVLPGAGVTAKVGNDPSTAQRVVVSHADRGIGHISDRDMAALKDFLDQHRTATVVVVQVEDEARLAIALADPVRDESSLALKEMHRLGLKTMMLTGDSEGTAAAVSGTLGIEGYRARQKPEDKLAWVKEAQEGSVGVCMVGDGINDGPALALADIGVAMGAGGTALAAQSADAVLMSDDLIKVTEAISLARTAQTVIYENIALAVTLKVVMLCLAMAGDIHLWTAVLSDVAGLLFVVCNGTRVLYLYPKLEKGGESSMPVEGYQMDVVVVPTTPSRLHSSLPSSPNNVKPLSDSEKHGLTATRSEKVEPAEQQQQSVARKPPPLLMLDSIQDSHSSHTTTAVKVPSQEDPPTLGQSIVADVQKRHRCSVCGSGFARAGGLTIHMLCHDVKSEETRLPIVRKAMPKKGARKKGG